MDTYEEWIMYKEYFKMLDEELARNGAYFDSENSEAKKLWEKLRKDE